MYNLEDYGSWKNNDPATGEFYVSKPFDNIITNTKGKIKSLTFASNIADCSFSHLKVNIKAVQKITILGDFELYISLLDGFPNLTSLNCPNITSVKTFRTPPGLNKLNNLNFPNLIKVPAYFVQYSNSLTYVNLPKAKIIGNSAFTGCKNLSKISFQNAKIIEESAFEDCSNLSSVFLPNVEEIGKMAFNECKKLTSITLPSLLKLDSAAFGQYNIYIKKLNCSKLKEMPRKSLFKGNTNIISIDLPSVQRIKDKTFADCKNLQSVNFNNVTQIGESAFADCANLQSVSFNNVTQIGKLAFWDCNSLKSINSPKLQLIGNSAFYNCKNLQSVNFNNVTQIGKSTFEYCANLQSVNFNSVTQIGSFAFEGCNSLKSISLPNVTQIDPWAFVDCNSLESISLPNVTQIDPWAFVGCNSLKSVNAPKLKNSNAFSDLNLKYLKTASVYDREKEGVRKLTVKDDFDFIFKGLKFPMISKKNIPLYNESGKPTPEDVKQENIGDCWLISALISLAKNQPDVIQKCLEDNGDTVTVKLYEIEKKNEAGKDIAVSKSPIRIKVHKSIPSNFDMYLIDAMDVLYENLPNEQKSLIAKEQFKDMLLKSPEYIQTQNTLKAEIKKHDSFSPKSALWVKMFEKAFSAIEFGNSYKKYLNYDNIDGGMAQIAFTAITGKTYKRKAIDKSPPNDYSNKQFRHIEERLNKHSSVTASLEVESSGRHAYSVEKVFVKNEEKFIVVKDPNRTTTDKRVKVDSSGTCTLKWDEFLEIFDHIDSERIKKK